ncbi:MULTISPECIES: Cdc6/Cdc18 family protein [Natronococcus]|uniref:ORC1-type DNA replication protein n=1 Tax=Natronococcus jeotgali DSM 18795 TaxID=1227498 RepID=L9WSA1_9EURY|nr:MULTISPECIES: orc1/cdc6 family replication initiation protein [Natronococcus]ELY52345.1 orc1/cdc6 family replication initiation protein [Natronococcus jeotgali DSM 18795]NKE35729.1 AAA family ATPase [Natronococcus sp. JC468]
MTEQAGGDPLFQSQDPIFDRKELLHVGHVPDEDRIVGRDDEIQSVASEIGAITRGDPPNNVMIYGKTGTGKSLISRHVATRARDAAEENEIDCGVLYVDCSEANTETRATRQLALSLADQTSYDDHIPVRGVGTMEYYQHIWSVLERFFDSVIVILDEIDKLDNSNILMQLSRAREARKTDAYIGVIGISNKVQYRETLDERIDSSFGHRELFFHPYDAAQLREIMRNRQDAFQPDVLEDGTIELCAALAAKKHGDARKAIEILKEAGELARRTASEAVSERHIKQAQEVAEINRIEELTSGATAHAKLALYALASCIVTGDRETYKTREIYERYADICELVATDPITENGLYRQLKEQAFLGVIESEKTGGGRSQGSYLLHRLVTDPKHIVKAVRRDDSLGELPPYDTLADSGESARGRVDLSTFS